MGCAEILLSLKAEATLKWAAAIRDNLLNTSGLTILEDGPVFTSLRAVSHATTLRCKIMTLDLVALMLSNSGPTGLVSAVEMRSLKTT
jgi:hypothetical protein